MNISSQTVYELLVISVIFILTDSIYLTAVSSHFKKLIQRVQGSPLELDLIAVVLCYMFLVGGLYWFVIRERRNWVEAGLLGLVIYGVYDMTTKAIIKNWDWNTAIMDTAWGGILFMIVSYLTYLVLGIKV